MKLKMLKFQQKYCQYVIFRQFNSRRVVVTGIGVVSPIGLNAKSAWKNLIDGHCGIKKLGENFSKLPCKVAATIPLGTGDNELNIEKYISKSILKTLSPSTIFALIACDEALTDSNWKPEDEPSKERTGVALGIGMVDLKDVCDTYTAFQQSYNKVSPYFVPRILPNMAAGQISIKYGFRGPNHSVSTACATGAHSIGDGYRFIKNDDADIMVCGGAEACINPLSLAGFSRLRALSTNYNDDPQQASRPFDKNRDGFVMGEGSAVVILENLEHAEKRGAKIYAEILGYGLSGDASHITAPKDDGSGAILSMQRALKEANLKPTDISYINAHATSTPIGDAIEARAIDHLFKRNSVLKVSSTKGSHGHLLGAAGNLESTFVIMSCFEGLLPPTLNLTNIEDLPSLDYVQNVYQVWPEVSKRIALKNSFGFGGTNATLCISAFVK